MPKQKNHRNPLKPVMNGKCRVMLYSVPGLLTLNERRNWGVVSMQTRKVFEAYMSNTKSLDEIAVAAVSDKQKEQMVKDNTSAFNEKLKTIFTGEQYGKYIKSEKR
jgi:hypothetical protein